ncbi:MAG: cytochrome P450, partial [Solirubrobacterales bacterium]|nr:cytochrome P450 [Solirubrobacterales bacterium]
MNNPTKTSMPPGPGTPGRLNQALFLLARNRLFRRWHDQYGDIYFLDIAGFGPSVVIRGAELHRKVFTAKDNVLHAGDNALGRLLGDGSIFSMDEEQHLAERRKLLPPFHGERMRSYEKLVEDEANREMDTWPLDEPFPTQKSFNMITLRIILRAVFGAEGRELSELEEIIPPMTRYGQMKVASDLLMRDYGRYSPGHRWESLTARFHEIIRVLIEKHLADPDLDERIDILALMLNSDLE